MGIHTSYASGCQQAALLQDAAACRQAAPTISLALSTHKHSGMVQGMRAYIACLSADNSGSGLNGYASSCYVHKRTSHTSN